jgi:dTDP-4-dehydrorhamnose reductase
LKLLIAGAKGQLGHDCLDVLRGRHELLGLDLPELDIADAGSVAGALDRFPAHVIVNCAAYTKVDAAETERDAAWRVNVEGARALGEAAARRGCRVIHISTDYVFDGRKPVPQPYVESDPTGPQCHYGVTKLAGEIALQKTGARCAILRTAWLYGAHGPNFLKTMLRLAVKHPGKPIRVVADQHGSATWSWRLAQQIAAIIEADAEGLFHATAEGHGTWFELAGFFLQQMGVPHEVTAITTADYPTPARRPANSILENARLKTAGLNGMVPWQVDVAEFVRRYRDRLGEEAK